MILGLTGALLVLAVALGGLWVWNLLHADIDGQPAGLVASQTESAASSGSASDAATTTPDPTVSPSASVTDIPVAKEVVPTPSASATAGKTADPVEAISKKYCGSGVVQMVAHTNDFTVAICLDGESLTYRGSNDSDGTQIELPAKVTLEGYSAFNSEDPTEYVITPTHLLVSTQEAGVLMDSPVVSFQTYLKK